MDLPVIRERPALNIVGIDAPFIHALSPDANNLEVIGGLWNDFLHRAREIPHRVGREMYGVAYALDESLRSHPDEMQYIAGVAVGEVGDLSAPLVSKLIPAGRFAAITHRGPISKIGETVGQLYNDWLPQSKFQHSGIADIEVYGPRFNPTAEASEMEYWISVREHPS